jgi:hypothetical protein
VQGKAKVRSARPEPHALAVTGSRAEWRVCAFARAPGKAFAFTLALELPQGALDVGWRR